MGITLENRYPGSLPFQDTRLDRLLFNGREQEKDSLFHNVLTEKLIVLFAKSGMGKTSLLNAGLMKELRDKRYIPFRITFTNPALDPLQAIYSTIDDIIKEKYQKEHQIDYKPGKNTTLWEYFKTAEFWSRDNILLTPVIILDQFEELFTLHSEERRKSFTVQLADLVRGRIPKCLLESLKPDEQFPYSDTPPNVKIIISIREDFLGLLEEMSEEIPDILHNRFRLLRLNREQAREAIERPAEIKDEALKTAIFHYSPDAIEAILGFLCKKKEKNKMVSTKEVEPFQLQLLCQHIENEVSRKPHHEGKDIIIQKSDLGEEKGMQRVLKDFYTSKIKQFDLWKRRRVRKLFEKRLISETNRRISLEEEEIERKSKVPKKILKELVNHRLLRAEPRVGSVYYELSHDTLIEPIRQSQKERKIKKTMVFAAILAIYLIADFIILPKFKVQKEIEKIEGQLKTLSSAEQQKAHSSAELNIPLSQKGQVDDKDRKIELYLKKAKLLIEIKKYDKAIEAYEAALRIESSIATKPEKVVDIINALKEKGKEGYVEKIVEVVSKSQDISKAKVYTDIGHDFYKNYKDNEAIKYYQKAIEIDPKYVDAYNNLGLTYSVQKKYDEAIKYYQKALQIDPNYFRANFNLGFDYYEQKKYDEAIKYYQKALQIDPNHLEANFNLGLTYSVQKKYDEAIKYYQKALQIDPNYFRANFNLGFDYYEQKKYDEAIKYYQKALQIDPNHLEANFSLGLTYSVQKKYDEAIKYYQKAIEIDPKYADVYNALCSLYNDHKYDYIKAYEMCEKVYNLAPDNIYGLTNFVEINLLTGRFDRAFVLANAAVKHKDISAEGKLSMMFISASSLLFQNKRPEALSALKDFGKFYKGLAEYERSWQYGGSKNFISKTSKLKKSDKELLLKMIEVLESPTKQEGLKKLEEVE